MNPVNSIFRRFSAIRDTYRNFGYDRNRYLKWAVVNRMANSQSQMSSSLVKLYHVVEKGLSLPQPRKGFGQNVVFELIVLMDQYVQKFGADPLIAVCVNVLDAYNRFNQEPEYSFEPAVTAVSRYRREYPELEDCKQGGTKKVSRKFIEEVTNFDFAGFVNSRSSVRQFTDDPVDKALLEGIIRFAQRSPSVCNRQSSRVHIYTDNEQKKKILNHQVGNRGFGDRAATIFIVTADLQHFQTLSERYQCWIDGGLFSMSILYAAHAMCLGACPLNWSATWKRDMDLRKEMGIPENETVIMMIALGHLPETFRVAQSTRKPIEEVIHWG